MVEKKQKEPKNKKELKPKKGGWRQLLFYTLIFLMILTFFKPAIDDSVNPKKDLSFSEFNKLVLQKQVVSININPVDSSVKGVLKDGSRFQTFIINYPEFIPELEKNNVNIKVASPNAGWLGNILGTILFPLLLFAGLWFFIFRQAQGANNQAMSFGKSRAKEWNRDVNVKTTFKDIAGIEEEVEELKEIVDFLKLPKKYQEIGARIPRGVLLMGPPGCGKTLLAKAIAGEANVPFFSISGSEFVEMFVGVGASRVRDLFKQAQKNQPAIIFVDEIDAVGRHRGAGLGGGHDEREQTLNQLLVEMDGFDSKTTVIVIAATNRPDILDPALLRPGRFDRQIMIDKPDIKGRRDILEIHAKKIKIDKEVDLEVVAKRTPGFTGADLANLVNEAALLAARKNKKTVSMRDLEEAVDRVIAGPEKKSKIMSKEEKDIIAYHETGHALVARMIPNTDPVHKISILPRGMALGYTLQLPIEDKYLVSRQEMIDQITILLGGRAAEEIVFSEITTGASNDIERATKLAHQMVCRYGMSTLGVRAFGKAEQNVFLGRDYMQHDRDFGAKAADSIDNEINKIIKDCYARAKKALLDNKKLLKEVATELIKKEVLEGDSFEKLLKGKLIKLA